MEYIIKLEAEIVELDEQIEGMARAISDKLAAPHKVLDLEEDAARLNTLVNLRKTKVAILELIKNGSVDGLSSVHVYDGTGDQPYDERT